MNRNRNHVLVVASLAVGLFVPARAWAASLTEVSRSTWTGGVSLPSYVQMYIYVPDKLATKPPIMVSSHSCGSSASSQMGNIPKSKAAADANGFIMILPDNPGQNCWDVGSSASLKHDGGGDTQAVAQMVKYALSKYNGDPARVYAMGGSSGGMMTQALMAVYPDVFRAGSARAGVPAGCWADGYDPSQQWSNNCAGGNTTKTAQQWGDLVRGMYPGYTGHRPRLQTMQGEADTTISYKNTAESIKEWTNVLGLPMTPSSMDTGYKAANATYDRQFWKNSCGYVVFEAWSSPGGTHSMPYEEADILKFFGLDVAGGADPEPDCNGDGGVGGTSGTGGTTGAGGAAGGHSGAGGRGGAAGTGTPGTAGVQGTAGTTGAAGAAGTGGSGTGRGGTVGTGGTVGSGGTTGTGGRGGSGETGGTVGSGGTTGRGGTTGSAGTNGTAGTTGTAGTGATGTGTAGSPGETTSSPGCSCVVASGERSVAGVFPLLLAALGLVVRRRRPRR